MTKIADFKKFKKAKQVVEDLENVMQILKSAQMDLRPYKHYTSLSETLLCIQDSRDILDEHLDHYKKILETKGQINEKT